MAVLSQLYSKFGIDVPLSDWNQLASLPQARKPEDVQKLFYPSADGEANQLGCRRQGFFTMIDDHTYDNLYQFILSMQDCHFVDVHSSLKTTKQDGKVMSTVITHVGQWMNRQPTKVNERESNKPLLRMDLLPALQNKYENADERSIELQEQVLQYVLHHAKEFTSPAVEPYLNEYPGPIGDAYTTRFTYGMWRDVLVLVREFAGPHLQCPCMLPFNSKDPQAIRPTPASAMTETICDFVCRVPEIANNPALQHKEAREELYKTLQPLLLSWAAKQCTTALVSHAETWQPSMIQLVAAERAKYDALLEPLCPPSPSASSLAGSYEAQGGNEVADHGLRSSQHGSPPEHSSLPSSPILAPKKQREPPSSQPTQVSAELSTEGLQSLRKLHRSKRASSRQEVQIDSQASSRERGVQQDYPSATAMPAKTKGSVHWRQLAKAQVAKKA